MRLLIPTLLWLTLTVSAPSSLAESTEDGAAEPVPIPAELEAVLTELTDAERAYLQSEAVLAFVARHELLFERLATKTPAAVARYVDALMRTTAAAAYDPDRDMAAVPLNTDADGFNSWRTFRPAELSAPREPGPIDLNRYLYGGPKLGIPTFFNMPVAMTPADLVAGEVDVAIMGVGLDTGSGARGAGYGPRAVRTGAIYVGQGLVNEEHMHTMVSPFDELIVVDYGDVAVDNLAAERSLQHIREMVRDVAATGTIPMIVGGDHSLMYPDAAGVVDVYGAGNVGIVHFDAHYDAGKGGSHLISHGMPVWRLFKEELVPGPNFIQVGLRGYWPNARGFEWMRENGLRYHTMAELERNGWDAVMKRAVREAREGPEHIFISFDVDVLDPAYMPGTGTPEPGGLTTREAFPIVRRLCAETNVVGFELVEVNPLMDDGYTTAQNSERILRECLTGIAMRRKGLVEEHYLSPLTLDHQQDG